MSVLIKGLEMPKNCMSCPFPAVGVDAYYCHCPTQDGKEYDFKYADTIPDTCPLVEVTEPSYTDAWCHDCSEYDNEHHCCHRWSHVIRKTVDELQLVHCKDCIYYDSDNKMCLDMIGFGRRWEETDYCSYGRRKE